MVTGNTDDPLWIGETGWSAPAPKSLRYFEGLCPDYFGEETLVKFYEMMMSWDHSLPGGDKVDHVFYFTMRDSNNHGDIEGFGMVGGCKEKYCKYSPGSPTPHPTGPTPAPTAPTPGTTSTCAKLTCGNHDTTCWCTDTCKAHNSCCPDYDDECGGGVTPRPTPTPAPTKPTPAPAMSMCADLKCGNHDETCWCSDTCKSHDSCCPDYDDICGGTQLDVTV